MSQSSTFTPAPVFLSDNEGQPAWAILSFDDYQKLLTAAGVGAADSTAAQTAVSKPPESISSPAATDTPSASAAPNATAQLLASLVENAQATAKTSDMSFDASKLQAKISASPMALEDLARSAGISPSYAAMIESGERQPSAPVLHSLARALSVSPEDLMS